MKSRMASMVHFLPDNPDAAALSSRGEQRREYLMNFLTHQLRLKDQAKVMEVAQSTSIEQKKIVDLHWWSKEKMDIELGPKKAEHWRQSGLLPTKADSVTGSSEDEFKEWGVPHNWERLTEADMKNLKIESSGQVDQKDMELLRSAETFAETKNEEPEIKKEKTELSKLEERITKLTENSATFLRRYQDMTLDAKMLLTLSQNQKNIKYATGFLSDLEKHVANLGKATKTLEKVAVGNIEHADASKLMTDLDKLDASHVEINTWADRFGFKLKPQKRKGKQQYMAN